MRREAALLTTTAQYVLRMLPGDASPAAVVDTAAFKRGWVLPRPPAGPPLPLLPTLLLLLLLLLLLVLPSRKAAASQAAASGFLAIRSVPAGGGGDGRVAGQASIQHLKADHRK
jgi:hypothetical protein